MLYQDRRDAGKRLAAALQPYREQPKTIVLALPRGGVPVAYEVAQELGLPLDAFVVRKLGLSGQKELAVGAIATGCVRVLNQRVVTMAALCKETIDGLVAEESKELERRERLFRRDRPGTALQGWTVILIDDGLATGSTMLAAVEGLRQQSPGREVVAVPVGAKDSCLALARAADELVYLVLHPR